MCVLVSRLCPAYCDPMDCSPLDYSVHGILQTKTLGWVAMPSFRGSSWLPALQIDSLLSEPTGKPLLSWKWKSLSRVPLCDHIEYTVHGILQVRILEWVSFPFSRGSSQPRDRTQVSLIAGGFFTSWPRKPHTYYWNCSNPLGAWCTKNIYMFVESWVYYSSFFHTVELWIVYKWLITEVKEFIIAVLNF